MKKNIFPIPFLLTIILFAGLAFGQPPGDFQKPPSEKQMEKIRKRVETLKMWKLTERLDLDERTASRLFPIINRYDKERLSIQQGMRKDMRELRRTVDTASEDELQRAIERLKDNHSRLQEINDEELGKIRGILSVRDMAKYIIFKQEFDREMKKKITKARGKKRRKFKEQKFD